MFFSIRSVIVAIILLSSFGCGGPSNYMKTTTTIAAPNEKVAVVRFFRLKKFQGGGRNFAIIDNEKAIGNLSNGSQFDYVTSPGKHLFFSIAAGFEPFYLEADLAAGKTYYVSAELKVGWTVARVFLNPITRGTEHWEKIDEYQKNLTMLEPNLEKLDEWSVQHKEEIRAQVLNYQIKWKEEYKSIWTKIRPEDGI